VRQANRPQGWLPVPVPGNSLGIAEENLRQGEVHAALLEAVCRLPKRLCQVTTAAYGLSESQKVSCTSSAMVAKHQRTCDMLYARQPTDEERQELKRMIRQEVGRVGQRAQMVLLSV
jgi:hypothetical protein